MPLNCLHRPASLTLIVWLCATFTGQRPITAEPAPPFKYTAGGILKAHRISITRGAVFAALANRNAVVRSAAADLATNRWPNDATHPIEQAMLNESIVWNRIGMASDLLRLGDRLGGETLVKVCHDTTEPGSARMAAAGALVRFKDDSCLDSVFDSLESATDLRDTDAKEQALELAPELIRHFGPERYQSVFQLVIKALGDPWLSVRMNASTILDEIGDPAAIPSLAAAIAQEKDEDVRRTLQKNLQDLQSKKHTQQR
jgi:HEAT repeat protein